MFSIPLWLADDKEIKGTVDRGRIYFYAEEITRTNNAIYLQTFLYDIPSIEDQKVWLPLSQVREYED